MVRVIRVLVGALGVLAGLFGAKLLLDLGSQNLVATVKWLVGGVVVHDGVIGPAVVLLAAGVGLLLRRGLPAAVIVGGVVLSSVTIVAIPVLGRFGAHADNPTLLDRSYGVGWIVFAGLTLLVVVVATWRPRRLAKGRGGDDGTGTGGR